MLPLAVIVGVLLGGTGYAGDPQLAALHYLEKEYPFDNDAARRTLASVGNLHGIEDWEISAKLKAFELFYFRSTWAVSPPSYEVIAAGADGKVLRLKDREDFNVLVAHEGLGPISPEGARLLARTYLRVTNITGIVNYELEEGIRVLNSIDDIPFKSLDERKKLDSALSISPPSLVRLGANLFRYVVFSWQREGSGAIDMRTIVVGPTGIVSSETKVLEWGIGMYDGIM